MKDLGTRAIVMIGGMAVLLTSRDSGESDSALADVITDAHAPIQHPTICRDCIQVDPVVVLGDRDGPGYIVATDYVVRDSLGRYWVGQYGDMIKVFDRSGNYVRQVGRPGAGPMEFGIPMPMFTDGAGRVHILDSRNARETIIGPDFALSDEQHFPIRVWNAAPLPDQQGYVANAARQTADGIGLPLHIIRGSDVIRSFGEAGTGVVTPSKLYRALAADRSGHIYSAWPYDYSIDVWTETGQHVRRLQGPDFAEGMPLGGPYSDENPPLSKIAALDVDEAGRLWLLISERKEDWRDHMQEVRLGNGRVALQPLDDDFGSIYRTRIDVLDLASGSVIGRSERGEYLDAFGGDGFMLEDRYAEDGVPQLVVWRYTWRNPTER